jgi:hypothetical protein
VFICASPPSHLIHIKGDTGAVTFIIMVYKREVITYLIHAKGDTGARKRNDEGDTGSQNSGEKALVGKWENEKMGRWGGKGGERVEVG